MRDEFLKKDFLSSLGILDWGYTEESKPRSFSQFKDWVIKSQHGDLNYLSDHRLELRSDIKNIFPEFKSALVFLFSYQETKKWMIENNRHEIAGYSLGFEGEDYHFHIQRKLKLISDHLQIPFHFSLDIQPVLERDLAYRAGLGWFGKNSMLISKKHGSYFIIGSLFLDKTLNLSNKNLEADHCGTCTRCADLCPTSAIDLASRTLVAEKCISTFTIETMKEKDPPEGFNKSRGEIFGCDICQDVCPWNHRPLTRVIGNLKIKDEFQFLKHLFYELPQLKLKELIESLSSRAWRKKLAGTCFDRPGKKGWLKNLNSSQSDS